MAKRAKTPQQVNEDALFYAQFRKNLQVLRKFHGMTAAELAKQMGMTGGHRITLLENTDKTVPGLRELMQFTKLFGVSLDDLMNREAVLTFKDLKDE